LALGTVLIGRAEAATPAAAVVATELAVAFRSTALAIGAAHLAVATADAHASFVGADALALVRTDGIIAATAAGPPTAVGAAILVLTIRHAGIKGKEVVDGSDVEGNVFRHHVSLDVLLFSLAGLLGVLIPILFDTALGGEQQKQ